MKTIHLLRTEPGSGFDSFHSLIDAVHSDGGRVGTLRWRPEASTGDQALIEAATGALLRAVDVTASGSVAHKPRTGPPVLRDVVREHFRGCRVVLVEGEAAGELATLPRISATADDRYRVETGDSNRQASASELAARLRQPRF